MGKIISINEKRLGVKTVGYYSCHPCETIDPARGSDCDTCVYGGGICESEEYYGEHCDWYEKAEV